jgi:hypothetical protein
VSDNAPRQVHLDQYTVIKSPFTGSHLVQMWFRPYDGPEELFEMTVPPSAAEMFADGIRRSAADARALNEQLEEGD